MSTPPKTEHNTSVQPFTRQASGKRNFKKVPYVEAFNGRLQGVVSSGSSAERVYVSWIDGESGDYYCSTNNNRRCGGLGWRSCKHIDSMITNAIAQYGGDFIAEYLGLEGEPGSFTSAHTISSKLTGSERKEQASEVFSRFLNYLRYMDMESSTEPTPELDYFFTG